MAARATWKGFLKLSLVSVPVKAFTTTASSNEIHLNQLHVECHNRIRYKKTCPEHGEVANDQIVSGYEYSKDQYVIVQPEELDKLRSESDRSVNIDGFIDVGRIDPIYHSGKTYFLVPDGPVGQKPYALLLERMRKRKVNAVVQVVLSGKDQIALLRPLDGLLAMSMLHHHQQIKAASAFGDELQKQELTDNERQLTDTLLDASTLKRFDLSKYHDRYTDNLTKLIQMKIAGEEVVQAPNPEEPKIINLMEALKKSVERAQSEARGPQKVAAKTRKMAPSARSKKSPAKRKSG